MPRSDHNYIHTTNSQTNRVFLKSLFNQVRTALIPITPGLEKRRTPQIASIKRKNEILKIKEEFKNYVDKLYVDSGAYHAFIKGTLTNRKDIDGYIETYKEFLMCAGSESHIDYIFSLDIPMFGGSDIELNYTNNIEAYNRKALEGTIEAVNKNNVLFDKIIHVWHWKMQHQYTIWNKLFEELQIQKICYRQGIGGLVQLAQSTGIKFSPFIGQLYNCLYWYNEFKDNEWSGKEMHVHLLGISKIHDRIITYFYQRLFNKYLNRDVSINTFDSISYTTSSMYVSHVDKADFGNDFKEEVFTDEQIRSIYIEEEYEKFKENLRTFEDRRYDKTRRVDKIMFYLPLHVYHQQQIDNKIQDMIEKLELVEEYVKYSDLNDFKTFETINGSILKEEIKGFTGIHFEKTYEIVMESLRITTYFHKWWKDGAEKEDLDELMKKLIKDIGYIAVAAEILDDTLCKY